MIPLIHIDRWRSFAPWNQDIQVEQDLILSRILVELFQDQEIADSVAFRGGTALYKLFIEQPHRYSEDIDLVQISSKPIGSLIDLMRNRLLDFLGEPSERKFKETNVKLVYKFPFSSLLNVYGKIKIEINTREHFNVLGLQKKEFSINTDWFSGNCNISTYKLEELIGTKIRALYQRRKGRDLFDLWVVLKTFKNFDNKQAVHVFLKYMEASNLQDKLSNPSFTQDILPLLSPTINFDIVEAEKIVERKIINLLP